MQENKHFLLVDRLVVPEITEFSNSLCAKNVCAFFQKYPRVHKIFVRNSGAGNGCANFMGT